MQCNTDLSLCHMLGTPLAVIMEMAISTAVFYPLHMTVTQYVARGDPVYWE